jgi:DNA-directed RNA polymerase specialized sigma24 family protein
MKEQRNQFPGETRASVIIGLCSQTSRKWMLFLQGGPYWNYIESFVTRKRFFSANSPIIEDVVNETIARVSKSLASGRFVYTVAGKGYFRAYLKIVARNVALDVLRKEQPYLSTVDQEGRAYDLNEKSVLLDNEADSQSDKKLLDEYDMSAEVVSGPKGSLQSRRRVRIVSVEDLKGVFDDGAEGTFDLVSMQRYNEDCTREEQRFLKKVQKNVFSMALVSVLADETVPLAKREMLNMLYVGGMKPGEIYALEDFKSIKRGTFDKKVFDAKASLEKPIMELWKTVAPSFCRNSEEKLQKLWHILLSKTSTSRIAKSALNRLKANDEMIEGVRL